MKEEEVEHPSPEQSSSTKAVSEGDHLFRKLSLRFIDPSLEAMFKKQKNPQKRARKSLRTLSIVEILSLAILFGTEYSALVRANTILETTSWLVWTTFSIIFIVCLFSFLFTLFHWSCSTPLRVLLHSSMFSLLISSILCIYVFLHSLLQSTTTAFEPIPTSIAVQLLLCSWIHLVITLCLPGLDWMLITFSSAIAIIGPCIAFFSGLLQSMDSIGAFQCFICSVPALAIIVFASRRSERLQRRDFIVLNLLETEREKTLKQERRYEAILSDILPQNIASKLKETRKMERALISDSKLNKNSIPNPSSSANPTGKANDNTSRTIAETHNNATIGFITLGGLDDMAPERLVVLLGRIFTVFDVLAERYPSVLKIKSLGTGIMFSSGIPEPSSDSAFQAVSLCVKMRKHIRTLSRSIPNLTFRAGISTETVVAGVIGRNKPHFDVWGDGVNISARLMQNCPPWQIQIASETKSLLSPESSFQYEEVIVLAKGKGELHAFRISEEEEKEKEETKNAQPQNVSDTSLLPSASLSPNPDLTFEETSNIPSSIHLRDVIIDDVNNNNNNNGSQAATKKSQSLKEWPSEQGRGDSIVAHGMNCFTLYFRDPSVENDWQKYFYRKEALSRKQFFFAIIAMVAASTFDYFFSTITTISYRGICYANVIFWIVPFTLSLFSIYEPIRHLFGKIVLISHLLSSITSITLIYTGLFSRLPSALLSSSIVLHFLGHSPFFLSATISAVVIPIALSANAVKIRIYLTEGVLLLLFIEATCAWLHYRLESQMRFKLSFVTLLKRESERLAKEQEAARDLLLSVLPEPVLNKLAISQRSEVIAQTVPDATVLFSDIVGFTALCSKISAYDVVKLLDSLFSRLDEVIAVHSMEKLKTVGDAYIAVSNVSVADETHASDAVAAGLDILNAVRGLNAKLPPEQKLKVRIGIHTGPLLAGVIQTKSYIFECYGETMKIAERLEESGLPNTVLVSESTWERTKQHFPYQKSASQVMFGNIAINSYCLTSSIVVTATLGGNIGGHHLHPSKQIGVIKPKLSTSSPITSTSASAAVSALVPPHSLNIIEDTDTNNTGNNESDKKMNCNN